MVVCWREGLRWKSSEFEVVGCRYMVIDSGGVGSGQETGSQIQQKCSKTGEFENRGN